jgi:hypothetical protein
MMGSGVRIPLAAPRNHCPPRRYLMARRSTGEAAGTKSVRAICRDLRWMKGAQIPGVQFAQRCARAGPAYLSMAPVLGPRFWVPQDGVIEAPVGQRTDILVNAVRRRSDGELFDLSPPSSKPRAVGTTNYLRPSKGDCSEITSFPCARRPTFIWWAGSIVRDGTPTTAIRWWSRRSGRRASRRAFVCQCWRRPPLSPTCAVCSWFSEFSEMRIESNQSVTRPARAICACSEVTLAAPALKPKIEST